MIHRDINLHTVIAHFILFYAGLSHNNGAGLQLGKGTPRANHGC